MYPQQNVNPYYQDQHRNVNIDSNVYQKIANIERQLDMLIKMMEYNNQMLRYMHQNNINTMASSGGGGGGAIIVRM